MRKLVLALLLTSCAYGERLTTQPEVIIDTEFQPKELAGILDGLNTWHESVPAFSFHVRYMEHAALIGVAEGHEISNAIYIVRNTGSHDLCPISRRELGDNHSGVEQHIDNTSTICFDEDIVNRSRDDAWRRITLHEVGHALYLPHMGPPSVMAPDLEDDLPTPTAADVAYLKLVWEMPNNTQLDQK